MKRVLFIALMAMYSCHQSEKSSQGESFTSQVNKVSAELIDDSAKLDFFDNPMSPVKQSFTLYPTGATMPKGWIKAMMEFDLTEGMVGALQDLYPGIKKDDLYRVHRRGGMDDIPEMGDIVLTGADWETSIMWWNSETAGNWWDGYVRHAFMTENKEAMQHAKTIVDNLVESQDEDGYIGIYKKNLRYQHEGSNGELWAQTTAFRTMLAYYEFTGQEEVLNAVKKAVDHTIDKYGENGRNPFFLKNAFGGVTHGLMFTDVCETLYRITGDSKYQEYAVFLYQAFSTYSINRSFNDLRYPYLIEKDSLFEGHGVHTYEHFRTLLNAAYSSGYPELFQAWDNALDKLDYALLPSGAGHGNEWLAKEIADPDNTTTEFCTMLELRNSFGSAVQKTGNVYFADQAEKVTFNGMMGFRATDGKSLNYGKGDNSCRLDGHHHGEDHVREDMRYKYSPTHSDVAVCCVPNYGRNYPYYLDHMWMKADDGIAAVLYGPSIFSTNMEGTELTIRQRTSYPMTDEIYFDISISEPTEFAIYFRKPEWSEKVLFSIEDKYISFENGFYKIEKEWSSSDEIKLTFQNEIQLKKHKFTDDYFFQKGPLVYAMPIDHKEQVIKRFDKEGFRDYFALPKQDDCVKMKLEALELQRMNLMFEVGGKNDDVWHQDTPAIEVEVLGQEQERVKVRLEPMGNTTLRQTTFEAASP